MPAYSGRLPRPYLRRPSAWWWLGRWTYLTFMLRDLSCVFMAYFVVVTLLQIRALGNGPEAYAAFEARLRNPLLIVLDAISLLFVVYHAVTFFNAASTATVVRVGGKRVPDLYITLPNYVAWAAASVVVTWLVLRA
jgi:fumarate reductase subunit C